MSTVRSVAEIAKNPSFRYAMLNSSEVAVRDALEAQEAERLHVLDVDAAGELRPRRVEGLGQRRDPDPVLAVHHFDAVELHVVADRLDGTAAGVEVVVEEGRQACLGEVRGSGERGDPRRLGGLACGA